MVCICRGPQVHGPQQTTQYFSPPTNKNGKIYPTCQIRLFIFLLLPTYSAKTSFPTMANSQSVVSAKKSKPYDNESTNCFDELPQETVIDILSRLPIKSLVLFTSTCRTLNPLSHDSNLVKHHLSRSRSDSSSSYLIIHSKTFLKRHQKSQLYVLQLSDQKIKELHVSFARSMPDFNILGSSDGLLCLMNSRFRDSIRIFNPFTRDYFEPPKHLDDPCDVIAYGFGFDVIAHDYKVVKIACYADMYFRHRTREGHIYSGEERLFNTNQTSQVTVYSKRSNVWADKGVIPYRIEMWSSIGVLASRRLHWVSVWGKHKGFDIPQALIVSYDLVDDEFRAIKGPCYLVSNLCINRDLSYHLSVLDGCLCASVPVISGGGSFDIWVMKEYGVEESWTKKYSIGEYKPASTVSYQMELKHHIWKNLFRNMNVKVVCVSEGGEVVLVYKGGGLVVYNPSKKSFKELEYEGMPNMFHATAHVGSLMPANLQGNKVRYILVVFCLQIYKARDLYAYWIVLG